MMTSTLKPPSHVDQVVNLVDSQFAAILQCVNLTCTLENELNILLGNNNTYINSNSSNRNSNNNINISKGSKTIFNNKIDNRFV